MSYINSTISLHDALPIYRQDDGHMQGREAGDALRQRGVVQVADELVAVHRQGVLECRGAVVVELPDVGRVGDIRAECRDRKSTRLSSSHVAISYAVFCLQ